MNVHRNRAARQARELRRIMRKINRRQPTTARETRIAWEAARRLGR